MYWYVRLYCSYCKDFASVKGCSLWSRRRLRTHRKAERDIGGRGTLKPFPRSSTRQPAAAAERCSACHQPRGAEEAISFR